MDLDNYVIGFIAGIFLVVLLQAFTIFSNEGDDSRNNLIDIVESTYCLPNTTLQYYGDEYINCCSVDNDSIIQNYVRNDYTVNIIKCYNALAKTDD
jgi:hypothetical protein